MEDLKPHNNSSRFYKLRHLPVLPYFLITDTFLNFRAKRYLNALATLVIAVILSGIWLGGYTLTALAGYQIVKQTVFEKTDNKQQVVTTSPAPVDCVINGIKTTAISKEKCDEWKDFSPPTVTQTLSKSNKIYPTVDPDPIITCNINANCGGGSRQMKKNECDQLTCCELGKSSWSIYPNKTACTQAQNNYNASKYPPCTIYYPALGYSKTYNYTTPSDCSHYQQRANDASKPLDLPKFEVTPFPTVEPYQYSQEYLNAVEKFNQEMSKPFQPSQFVAPTPIPTQEVSGCYGNTGGWVNCP